MEGGQQGFSTAFAIKSLVSEVIFLGIIVVVVAKCDLLCESASKLTRWREVLMTALGLFVGERRRDEARNLYCARWK